MEQYDQPELEQLRQWLHSFPPRWTVTPPPVLGVGRDAYKEAIFKEVTYELRLLIDLFGYQDVYLGIACEVFADPGDPWEGDDV